MNRCTFPLNRRLALLAASLTTGVALMATPVAAQEALRQFPAHAERGILEVTTPPNVLINGQPQRLSPGARIKGSNNLLVLSASLVGQQHVVNYLRENQGLIHEVWLLTATEAAQEQPRLPQRRIDNGLDTQTPTADNGQKPFNPLPQFPRQ